MSAIAARIIRDILRRPVLAGLAIGIALTAFQGTATAANWLIVHRDGVQTVYVDRESIKRSPESIGAWIKGEINPGAGAKEKSIAGYESYYHIDCNGKRYRVTETTFSYTDGSKETARMADAPWKETIDRVYFLYEYLCGQVK